MGIQMLGPSFVVQLGFTIFHSIQGETQVLDKGYVRGKFQQNGSPK